jgi:adenylosuccinate synthase
MPATVIVGGQFGSEGKGKVAYFLAQEMKAQIAVRVGGSNSGHTVIDEKGTPIIFRHLPTAAILPKVTCVLTAGNYINTKILLEEVEIARIPPDNLIIDPYAMIVTDTELNEERKSLLHQRIGSTLSGTGAAISRRIGRHPSILFAKDERKLGKFLGRTARFLRKNLADGVRIIVEGTQGFGLSLLHSEFYPYVTSRETTAAAFISEAGLSPIDVDDIVLVLRSFPIRVGGNSGPLPNEIDWKTVTEESGASFPLIEYTSVTKTLRRVGYFDPEIVQRAIQINQPTRIALNHLDYVDASCRVSQTTNEKVSAFVADIESLIKRRIDYLGFGPDILIEKEPTIRKVYMI